MKKTIVLSILLLGITFSLAGQEKITLKSEKISDLAPTYLFKGKSEGYLFKVGEGEYEAVGHRAYRLEALLRQDEAAYKEFKKFKRKTTVGNIIPLVGLTGIVTGTAITDETDTEQQYAAKFIGGFAFSIISIFVGDAILDKAPQHLYNAVEIYNKNL